MKNCLWRRGIADGQNGPLGTDCGKLSRRCHGAGSRRSSSGTPSWSSGSSGPGQTFNFSTIKHEIQLKNDKLILSPYQYFVEFAKMGSPQIHKFVDPNNLSDLRTFRKYDTLRICDMRTQSVL